MHRDKATKQQSNKATKQHSSKFSLIRWPSFCLRPRSDGTVVTGGALCRRFRLGEHSNPEWLTFGEAHAPFLSLFCFFGTGWPSGVTGEPGLVEGAPFGRFTSSGDEAFDRVVPLSAGGQGDPVCLTFGEAYTPFLWRDRVAEWRDRGARFWLRAPRSGGLHLRVTKPLIG